jgi:hypothetical protein
MSSTDTTTSSRPLAAVRHRIQVPLDPPRAFELFTAGMARWWPMVSHSCSAERDARLAFEARVGGQVVETSRDGQRHVWGTLTAWKPPQHFAMTWHPGRDASEATQLDVRFGAGADGGCIIELTHDGWTQRGNDAAQVRDGYVRGWPLVLEHFEHLAGAAA